MSFNTISIIGLGYIGLPTAAMFASKFKKVIGVDTNQNIVQSLNNGKTHIAEPKLQEMVKEAVDGGFLTAVNYPEQADAFLITVPTPILQVKDGDVIPKPDLSFIESAAKSVAKVLKKGDLVILESTSPIGATEQMSSWLAEIRTDLTFPHTHGEDSDIRVAYCPERVLPGKVVKELVNNDRVIGGITKSCSESAIKLYNIFIKGDCITTSPKIAEMTKLTENAFRDINIAFANELSSICDHLKIDVFQLINIANRHPRVNILRPGPGVGGHCIAVDPWFIASSAPEQAKLINVARNINDQKPDLVVDKVINTLEKFLINNSQKSASDVTIACFGLAYKADIDDLRESPAVTIVERLLKALNCKILVIEPNINKLPNNLQQAELITSSKLSIQQCDIALLLVDHNEFKSDLRLHLEDRYIIDTIGLLKRD